MSGNEGFQATDFAVLETNGIRKNARKTFQINLTGKELYDLLKLLEDHATQAESYLEVRALVLAAETIRNQARDQGF